MPGVAPGSAIASSFRDPAGRLFSTEGRIFRVIGKSGREDLEICLQSKTARRYVETGRLVCTEMLSGDAADDLLACPDIHALFESIDGHAIVEHERIPFPSFPYEWAPEMLHAAGVLTLDFSRDLLAEGLGLKDGTPYNVLFRGPEPVFIDLLSIEKRDPGDPTWLPYAQFVRTFLLPLLANKYLGVTLDQVFITRRDGLEPEEVYRWLAPLKRIRPPFLGLVSMPSWLGARHDQDDASIYRKKALSDPEKARFILESLLNGARSTLNRLAPTPNQTSVWSDYMESNNNYSREQFAAKQAFVERVMAEFAPRRVLDVGCNTGHFSAIAARAGAGVVAIDYDPVVVGRVWQSARAERLNILPLVVNLTRPSPGMGWRNRECAPFLERARGAFEAVMMLAVIHHMLVTERVPLEDILGQAAELTTDLAIIEFIAPEDSMFRRLTRGRDHLHSGLTNAVFEEHARRSFEIVRCERVGNSSRYLYLLRKRR